jgi:phosphoserine aminotransferase
MLCVEDYRDALAWADSIGGLPELVRRSDANLDVVRALVQRHGGFDFLAEDPSTVSSTSITLKVNDMTSGQVKALVDLMESEGVGLDIGSYRDAPAGLRIWGGATVDPNDTEALCNWLEWGYEAICTSA